MDVTNLKIKRLRDSDNWHQWRFIVRTVLEDDEDLLDASEGRLIAPAPANVDTDAAQHEAATLKFEKADKAALNLIVTKVDRKLLDILLNFTTEREMWVKLNAVHDMKSEENLSLVQKQFFEYKWDSGDSVAHNVSKLENLVTKIKALGGEIPESMLMSRVLSTLPKQFNHFHSAWDSVDESKKKIENLITRLMSEEARLKKQEEPRESSVGLLSDKEHKKFVSKNKTFRKTDLSKSYKGDFSCYTCGKKGHKRKDCSGCYTCV